MREYYQQELSRLKDELYLLGSMVSNALKESLDALLNHDQQAAVRLIGCFRDCLRVGADR